jgi:cytochrome P450
LLNDIPARVGKTLGTSDPPKHTFARGLVNKAFTPGRVAQLKPTIQALARELSTTAREKGQIEFVADISAPFNAAILGNLFGVPAAEFILLRHWLDDFFLREPPIAGQEPKQVIAMRELRNYLNVLADQRRRQPTDDLLTAMLLAEDDDGHHLEQEQVVVTTMTFLTAGFESTNNLFTNLTYALAQHPHIFAALKQDLGLIPAFVEEGMRYDAAAQGFVRSPKHDVELYGKTIPAGAQVLLHIGAANRDERQFEQSDTFDLQRFHQGRQHQRHLGLGQGIHFCVGAPLGRDMAYVLFEELVAVSKHWEVDLANAARVTTPNFRGFARLPLRIG